MTTGLAYDTTLLDFSSGISPSENYTVTICLRRIDTILWRHSMMCPSVSRKLIAKGKAVLLQALSGPEGSRKLRFPDFITTAQDGGKIVSLTHRPPLTSGNAPGIHFCRRLRRPQGYIVIGRILCQGIIPMTPAGIEPATFRFVAQHLNHCATAVPKHIPTK